MERVEGIEIVRAAVADCLALEPDEVTPEQRIVSDLGADSLDLLDLVFTLEKRLGVKMQEQVLDLISRPDGGDSDVRPGGYLSAERVALLARWLPELGDLQDPEGVTRSQVAALITVEALWRMIEEGLPAATLVEP